jgi:hypothetical protein
MKEISEEVKSFNLNEAKSNASGDHPIHNESS